MRWLQIGRLLAFVMLVGGCASEQTFKREEQRSSPSEAITSPSQKPESTLSDTDVSLDEVLVASDSLITVELERARQHYLSAMTAQEAGDSMRAIMQFEQSLQILNELSYYPEVETNHDFTDLSKAVVEEYERFIRLHGGVDSTSSVFALREKLNQLSEQVDTSAVLGPKRVITGTTIPLVVNELVERHIQFFTQRERGRGHMERWLQRSGKYFPEIHAIMREEGVPVEIAYLAMIESGLNNSARSWASAVGMWQFIRGTGKLYGLEGDFWQDDRRDFHKATRAAARHLRDLYEEFEDWYLVMAGYNAGPGNVYRAMRRSGSRDFWEMRKYLPRETRNYVPAYIAVAVIGMNPTEYGFGHVVPDPPLEFDEVMVDECVDLQVLAECVGTDVETLRDLNPALLHRCTPPGERFVLKVPKGTDKELFAQKYAQIPQEKKGYLVTHTVRKGDTLRKVAHRYGVSQQALADANNLSRKAALRRGSRLLIPVAKSGGRTARAPLAKSVAHEETLSATGTSQNRTERPQPPLGEPDKTRIAYKVKSGDTIGHIAEWFNVRAADIRNWNNLPYGRVIRVGQTLHLWVDKDEAASMLRMASLPSTQKTALAAKRASSPTDANSDEGFLYTVRQGDSLEKIAADHSVAISQIKRWNNLTSSRILAGEKLRLYPQVTEVGSHQERKVAEGKAIAKGDNNKKIYVVRRGDTISQIAQQHSVEEAELRKWNSLGRSNMIYAGQELIIHKGSGD